MLFHRLKQPPPLAPLARVNKRLAIINPRTQKALTVEEMTGKPAEGGQE